MRSGYCVANHSQGDDDVRYNAIAVRAMTRHGIPTNDLYALTAGFAPAMFTFPGDVHFFAEEGMALIVQQVGIGYGMSSGRHCCT